MAENSDVQSGAGFANSQQSGSTAGGSAPTFTLPSRPANSSATSQGGASTTTSAGTAGSAYGQASSSGSTSDTPTGGSYVEFDGVKYFISDSSTNTFRGSR